VRRLGREGEHRVRWIRLRGRVARSLGRESGVLSGEGERGRCAEWAACWANIFQGGLL
jgi:hypothetical protein